MSTLSTTQAELISDDPRCEPAAPGMINQLKLWRKVSKEHGGLMSQQQAATLCGVTKQTIYSKIKRGHFSTYELFGLKCIPYDEIVLYLKEREEGQRLDGRSTSAGGKPAPSYWELLKVK